jgi:hypothetical protein
MAKVRDRTAYQKEYRARPEVILRKREQNRIWVAKWRKDNPEKDKENRKRHYEKRGREQIKNWTNNTLNGRYKMYKDNCKRNGKLFEISKEYFAKFWKEPCYYCGKLIDVIRLDRIDSKKGYVLGNIRSCCFECNQRKSDLSEEEFLKQIERIYLHRIKK